MIERRQRKAELTFKAPTPNGGLGRGTDVGTDILDRQLMADGGAGDAMGS
jgi:hypothetical protein